MNEFTLNELKMLVERAVRPVRCSRFRKRQMREELLAHLITIFEEEAAKLNDERAALEQTARRFGQPAELSRQLQLSVPARDSLEAFLDRIWLRPGESLPRRAIRCALIFDAIVLLFILSCMLLLVPPSEWRMRLELYGTYQLSILLAFFLCAFGFTILSDWIRQSLYSASGRSWPRAILVLAASALLLPGFLAWGMQVSASKLTLSNWLMMSCLEVLIPAAVVILAYGTKRQLHYLQEWASLQI